MCSSSSNASWMRTTFGWSNLSRARVRSRARLLHTLVDKVLANENWLLARRSLPVTFPDCRTSSAHRGATPALLGHRTTPTRTRPKGRERRPPSDILPNAPANVQKAGPIGPRGRPGQPRPHDSPAILPAVSEVPRREAGRQTRRPERTSPRRRGNHAKIVSAPVASRATKGAPGPTPNPRAAILGRQGPVNPPLERPLTSQARSECDRS